MSKRPYTIRGTERFATADRNVPPEAVAAVKRDLIGELPKMRRAGRTDVSDLAVSVNAVTLVSEPLYAVA